MKKWFKKLLCLIGKHNTIKLASTTNNGRVIGIDFGYDPIEDKKVLFYIFKSPCLRCGKE